MVDVRIRQVETVDELECCRNVRRIVFQVSQNVPKDIEEDRWDAAPVGHDCAHFSAAVANQNGDADEVVGTCRIRKVDAHWAKLERVAVRSEYRRSGIGRQLNEAAIAYARQRWPDRLVKTHAQLPVVDFYGHMNFLPISDVFYEADIGHYSMILLPESAKEVSALSIANDPAALGKLPKLEALFEQKLNKS